VFDRSFTDSTFNVNNFQLFNKKVIFIHLQLHFAFAIVNCLHSATNLQTEISSITLLTLRIDLQEQKISIDLMQRTSDDV